MKVYTIGNMISYNIKKIIKNIIQKLYFFFFNFFSSKLKILNRHSNYEDYLNKQKEKTLDKKRIEKWFGEEWNIKLQGFRDLFDRNFEIIKDATKCICLGARTGQEVSALHELNKEAIGIDLVAFPPLTVEGDIHNLSYPDREFDFVFTNIFDHSIYPDRFVSEMERISKSGGSILINLQLSIKGDEYSENIINDARELIKLFNHSKLLYSRPITNTFDGMNWEVAMKKN